MDTISFFGPIVRHVDYRGRRKKDDCPQLNMRERESEREREFDLMMKEGKQEVKGVQKAEREKGTESKLRKSTNL